MQSDCSELLCFLLQFLVQPSVQQKFAWLFMLLHLFIAYLYMELPLQTVCQVLFHPWLLKTYFRDKSVEQLNSSSSTSIFGLQSLKDLAVLYAMCNL